MPLSPAHFCRFAGPGSNHPGSHPGRFIAVLERELPGPSLAICHGYTLIFRFFCWRRTEQNLNRGAKPFPSPPPGFLGGLGATTNLALISGMTNSRPKASSSRSVGAKLTITLSFGALSFGAL